MRILAASHDRIGTRARRASLLALGVLASLGVLGLTLTANSASALSSGDGNAFHYDIERFTIMGPGSATLANEEFNESDPLRFQADASPPGGSVLHNDGALHLTTTDGFDDTSFSLVAPGLELRRARAVPNGADFAIFDGQGDFTMESEWRTGPDDVNAGISMGLVWVNSSSEIHTLSITLRDYAAENLSAPFTGDAGLAFSIERSVAATPLVGTDPVITNFEQHSIEIDPAAVTASIFLRLVFDDVTNTFTALTSTDGGTSFPVLLGGFTFDPSQIFGERGASPFLEAHEIVSIADDLPNIPEPSSALLIAIGLVALSRRPARRAPGLFV